MVGVTRVPVRGRRRIPCADALAKDRLEHRLATTLRRILAGVVAELVAEIDLRAKGENRR